MKVFRLTRVQSIYRSASAYRRRTFTFSLPDGVGNETDEPSPNATETTTTVTLADPVEPYRDQLGTPASTLAVAIARHFLLYYLRPQPPRIKIVDNATDTPVAADTMLARQTSAFVLGGQQFTVEHTKVHAPELGERRHAVHYCAAQRAVRTEPLRHLPNRALWEGDETFFYHAYVSSPFLEAAANDLRTDFDIPEDTDFFSPLSKRDSASALRTSQMSIFPRKCACSPPTARKRFAA